MTQHGPGLADQRMEALLAADEDLRRLVAGDWMRYRTSPALQELSWEAHSTRAKINHAPGVVAVGDPCRAIRSVETGA